MRRALALARRGWGQVAPNPMVGAVVLRDGEVVGEGWHAAYGAAHAEVVALRAAGEAARGATLVVTLEPCAHQGKTPPCTEAILAAGVRRVVYAAADPNPVAAGGGAVLRAAGLDVASGVEEDAARALNAPFFHRFGPEAWRPWVLLKLALSLDGRLSDAEGRARWITGPRARAAGHRLRAGVDAVLVGSGTALADDPLLTVRSRVRPRRPPVRVVWDRRLRLPPTARLLRTRDEGAVWILTDLARHSEGERAAWEARGVRLLPGATLAEGLASLRQAGVDSVLVEGGATLAGALLAEGYVDRLALFWAPRFLGAGGGAPFAALPPRPLAQAPCWRRRTLRVLGEDVLLELDRPADGPRLLRSPVGG